MLQKVVAAVAVVLFSVTCWFVYNKFLKVDNKQDDLNPVQQQVIKDTESTSHFRNANLTFEIVESENGTWGYSILNEQKVIIVQPNKPGLPGNEGFKTKEHAQKVAEFVISKIRAGQMPPTVTVEELRELGVL